MDAATAFTRTTLHPLPTKKVTANDPREMNGWRRSRAVHDMATDPEILGLLSELKGGRQPRPFQTVNFCRSPMKPLHSDLVHFDSLPTRGEMIAAWVALEDVHTHAGPLTLYSGSHEAGFNDFEALGVSEPSVPIGANRIAARDSHLEYYQRYLRALRDRFEPRTDVFREMTIKRGQVLLWNGSLVHGSKPVADRNLTRMSQVAPSPPARVVTPQHSTCLPSPWPTSCRRRQLTCALRSRPRRR